MATKERGVLDYLGDWNTTSSPKGSEETGVSGGDYEYGNPYRAPMPETPEWGLNKDGGTSFGHSDDVVEKQDYKAWPDLDRDDVARGYSTPKSDGEGSVLSSRQVDGSFPASIPSTNAHTTHDRSREFRTLEEGAHSGTGNDNPHPGTEQIGSRENLG
jgi:hypothetical protein